jgi:hypothetical protein
MLSRFGQECLLRGYTLEAFENWEDDDPIEHEALHIEEPDEDEGTAPYWGSPYYSDKDVYVR